MAGLLFVYRTSALHLAHTRRETDVGDFRSDVSGLSEERLDERFAAAGSGTPS